MIGLLGETSSIQASETTSQGDAFARSGVFSTPRVQPVKMLDDGFLGTIRGRFVDGQVLGEDSRDFIILWDERPAGSSGDGKGTGKSHSTGLGNHQSTSVTTRQGQ